MSGTRPTLEDEMIRRGISRALTVDYSAAVPVLALPTPDDTMSSLARKARSFQDLIDSGRPVAPALRNVLHFRDVDTIEEQAVLNFNGPERVFWDLVQEGNAPTAENWTVCRTPLDGNSKANKRYLKLVPSMKRMYGVQDITPENVKWLITLRPELIPLLKAYHKVEKARRDLTGGDASLDVYEYREAIALKRVRVEFVRAEQVLTEELNRTRAAIATVQRNLLIRAKTLPR